MTASTSGKLGVNYADTPTSPQFALGTLDEGEDGTLWVYVQANGAIGQYDAVAIDEDYQAAKLTKSLADAGQRLGVAQSAFADNDYGWVALRGSNIKVNALTSCAADTALYTSATAGSLDDDSTSQTAITGIVIVSAVGSGGAAATECIITLMQSK